MLAQLIIRRRSILRFASILILLVSLPLPSRGLGITFTLSPKDREAHLFHVQMECSDLERDQLTLVMPTWTPGYYQMLNFAGNVKEVMASDTAGRSLQVVRRDENSWQIDGFGASPVTVDYDVVADRNFVATPYLDEKKAYLLTSGLCFFPEGEIHTPVKIIIEPDKPGLSVATGLEPVADHPFEFSAENYDVLYDSPLLLGELTPLPSFSVRGIPHHFIALDPGDFDYGRLMDDLKKIVETAVDLIGDIPYQHYTFIGIGAGRGGIEHRNSTTVSLRGINMDSRQAYLGQLFFLAHEYFHTYNVKSIRPIELGPFDYLNGSRTHMLWVAEGLTVYYEYLLLRRAGLCSEEELLQGLQNNITALQNRPGRFVQTLAEASYETWRDGPFGGMGEGADKTISYYDKGPLVGLLLDLEIRHASGNRRSLDDVMRKLYEKYYLEEGRGFTEDEFRSVCEEMAGRRLDEIFDYVYTTRELDYDKYLLYAGYKLDPSDYSIDPLPSPDALQESIRRSWLDLN